MYTRALALICIFPRRHNDREVTCDLCVGVRIIIIFKRYRRRRRSVSTLSDSRQTRSTTCECARSRIIRHRLAVGRGAHLGSRTPRGVTRIGFSGPLRWPEARCPVTSTSTTALCNGPPLDLWIVSLAIIVLSSLFRSADPMHNGSGILFA